jgi:hypothetical protein
MSLQRSSPEPMKMTMPCPECEGEMLVSAVTPTMFGNTGEDIVYRCRKCGFIRTRRSRPPGRPRTLFETLTRVLTGSIRKRLSPSPCSLLRQKAGVHLRDSSGGCGTYHVLLRYAI